ncbi:MAG: hypothetical protein QG622_1367 [Actinomycetota bacterium]|nr:hypothetical protein [Actinomycetota bacterium]
MALTVALAVAGAAEGAEAAETDTVTCRPAVGFSRLSGGPLYRLQDDQPLTGASTFGEVGQIGSGWGGFAWTGAGGDGVVYALTTAGKLLWYRYDTSTRSWMAKGGSVVGIGFTPTTKVVNVAVGAGGWIYIVRPDGKLVIYQHLGRLTGAATWASSAGHLVGSGWTADELIAPQGDGVIYRQIGGSLFWYRHSDPSAGPVTWNNGGRGTKVGTGWRFYDLLPLGGGVLMATAAPSGQVTLWRHGDPVSGGQGWPVINLKKYLARADSFGVIVGPDTCS